MKKLLKGDKLKQRAEGLGIECSGLEIRQCDSCENALVYEFELQRKVIEAERSIREHKLWIFAFISAIASALSAAAAFIAIFSK